MAVAVAGTFPERPTTASGWPSEGCMAEQEAPGSESATIMPGLMGCGRLGVGVRLYRSLSYGLVQSVRKWVSGVVCVRYRVCRLERAGRICCSLNGCLCEEPAGVSGVLLKSSG